MSKYVDTTAIVQIIGSVFVKPSLLEEEEKYHFYPEDFPEEFHRILFGSISNLFTLGASQISVESIEDYLNDKPSYLAVYKTHRGREYLQQISKKCQIPAFDYYYGRLKKMTLLRMYNEVAGLNLDWLYDCDNILDIKKKQLQEEWLDNHSLEDIDNEINDKIINIRMKYVDNSSDSAIEAGQGLNELLERLRQTPDMGFPLFGPYMNTVTRGARLKKFYLRSAATGVGKTRAMIADTCFIGSAEIYDVYKNEWISTGATAPVLYITTEQEREEIQTMMLAFISGVNEEHIISSEYMVGEFERVKKAVQLIMDSKIFIEELPDFSLKDIENTIKRGIREFNIQYIFFDYIHTSIKILEEVSSKAKVKGLREDNILFMISTRLKDICNEYGVFILSSTQLNSDYTTAKEYDQNLLRGAKAIADKIDCGMIMLETSQDDLAALETIIQKGGYDLPQIKISIYKNRRNKYKRVLLWCRADRGTCRIEPMFMTNYQYELINIEDTEIKVEQKEESAF